MKSNAPATGIACRVKMASAASAGTGCRDHRFDHLTVILELQVVVEATPLA